MSETTSNAKEENDLEKEIREKAEMEIRGEYAAKIAQLEERIAAFEKTRSKISKETIVPVTSNFPEPLIYVSKKTAGYTVEWDSIGNTEYMEIGELIAMRNSDKRFFEDNWIIFGGTDNISAKEVYEYLKVSKYYENMPDYRNTEEILALPQKKLISVFSALSNGMKDTLISAAAKKAASGKATKAEISKYEKVFHRTFQSSTKASDSKNTRKAG